MGKRVHDFTDITLLAYRAAKVSAAGIIKAPRRAFMGLFAIGKSNNKKGVISCHERLKLFYALHAIEKKVSIFVVWLVMCHRAKKLLGVKDRMAQEKADKLSPAVLPNHPTHAFPPY
jgi:hypothetical protein